MSRSFKVFKQHDYSDCGFACVQMLANHYGKRFTLNYLKEKADYSKEGLSLKCLKRLLNSTGFDCEAVSIPMQYIKSAPLPAILFWEKKHYVIIYNRNVEKDRYCIADPYVGKSTVSEEELYRNWEYRDNTGVVILSEPNEEFDKIKEPRDNTTRRLLGKVYSILKKHRKRVLSIGLLSVICLIADFLMPFLLQTSFDSGISQKNIHIILMIAMFQVCILAGNLVSNGVISLVTSRLGWKLNYEMAHEYLSKLFSFSLSFFDKNNSGDLIQKLDDQDRLRGFIMQIPRTILPLVLNLIVLTAIFIYYNALLYLCFMFFFAIEITWNCIFVTKRKRLDNSSFCLSSKNRNMINECIYGIKDIKCSGSQNVVLTRWTKIQDGVLELGLRTTKLLTICTSGQSFISGIKDILLTVLTSVLVIKSNLTVGEMLAVGFIIGRLSGPFNSILTLVSQSQDAKFSFERVDSILNMKPEKTGETESREMSVEFVNCSFRYFPTSEFILKNLSITIEAGKVTAIVGESGCGKTTLLKLILGMYKPVEGNAFYGSIPVERANLEAWRDKIGIVMQDGILFSDTILANVALSDLNPSREKAKECLEMVGLRDFVEGLPFGLETIIGNLGIDVSGGQKQRLLIARALYQQPDLLILDEATSSLDAMNESLISKNIQKYQRGKTLIISAHRLSTIKNADKIIVLKDGVVAESGTHGELLTAHGAYYQLIKSQM